MRSGKRRDWTVEIVFIGVIALAFTILHSMGLHLGAILRVIAAI